MDEAQKLHSSDFDNTLSSTSGLGLCIRHGMVHTWLLGLSDLDLLAKSERNGQIIIGTSNQVTVTAV